MILIKQKLKNEETDVTKVIAVITRSPKDDDPAI